MGFIVVIVGVIYGLYIGVVYFLGLLGGWLVDCLIGGKNVVWYGGIIIFVGYVVFVIDL